MHKTNSIRKINFQDVYIGGESEVSDIKPVFALELNIFNFEDSSHIVKDYYSTRLAAKNLTHDFNIDLINLAQASDCDILALKFNLPEADLKLNIEKAKILLKELLPHIKKPLLICGANNRSIDKNLLPELVEILDRQAIIAFAEESTYKYIVPSVLKGGHILAIRTPIDINLAKEMNILTSDMGLEPDRILIDTDMGGLGYGLEYGYSIMERIKLAGFGGDKMLNMPLIAFAGEEALKSKETKTDSMSSAYGDFKQRTRMFELTTASAVIAAGANVIVLNSPENIDLLKNML